MHAQIVVAAVAAAGDAAVGAVVAADAAAVAVVAVAAAVAAVVAQADFAVVDLVVEEYCTLNPELGFGNPDLKHHLAG